MNKKADIKREKRKQTCRKGQPSFQCWLFLATDELLSNLLLNCGKIHICLTTTVGNNLLCSSAVIQDLF